MASSYIFFSHSDGASIRWVEMWRDANRVESEERKKQKKIWGTRRRGRGDR
jgi:hypothetical protein